jgi:hypothetical protein
MSVNVHSRLTMSIFLCLNSNIKVKLHGLGNYEALLVLVTLACCTRKLKEIEK